MFPAAQRRKLILQKLSEADAPLSASSLAADFMVSRQIIVGDIALLRAAGEEISATPRGYILEKTSAVSDPLIRRIACNHTSAQMEEELQLCIDFGCEVLDVIVEHPVYGQLVGQLQLKSRYDIHLFMEKVRQAEAHALSELTDGIHLHTLRCPSEEAFCALCKELTEKGIRIQEE